MHSYGTAGWISCSGLLLIAGTVTAQQRVVNATTGSGIPYAREPLDGQEFLVDISGTGIVDVPLSAAGLTYRGDLLMVLELLEAPTRPGKIYIGGAIFKRSGYGRAHPGQPWRRFNSTPSLGTGFALEVAE